jgi:lipopolysaccharide/colanic/teichoic acid biosynthesis glycosyltransferase
MITRLLDIVVSCIGLLLLLLILPWIGLLIKIDSRGPIFYRCKRVGKGGKLFQMYKFRTMHETPDNWGPSLSPRGDPRVTPVGRVLRRLKLNEFPQFINVLKGDLTLIGPRPEAPDLAVLYPPAAKKIFSVKPGLFGPNQILGRNEEELYPPGVDPVKYYLEHILPRKLSLDLAYIRDKSIFKNLKYLFLSLKVTVTGAINRRHLMDNRSQIYLMLTDAGLCILSFALAHYLRFDSLTGRNADRYLYGLLPWVVLIRLPIFIYCGFYHTLIRYISFHDIKTVVQGVAISSLFLICATFFWGQHITGYSRGVFIIDWFCLTTFLVGYRAGLKKLYLRYKNGSAPENTKRVLIWGAGDAGELCLRYLQNDNQTKYEVVGFLDDAPLKHNRRLNGVKILGNRHHLELLTKLYKIQEVFLAMPNLPKAEVQLASEKCSNLGLEAKLFQLSAVSCNGSAPEHHSASVDLAPACEISPRLSTVTDHRK